jgi:phosphoenolpyruvate carboxykinase (ATP)
MSAAPSKQEIIVNADVLTLTAAALHEEMDSTLTDTGALSVNSYLKKGRSPKDKRVVDTDDVVGDVNWGAVNIKLSEDSFQQVRARALKYLERQPKLYVTNAFAGHDPRFQLKIRIVTTRPYHALFMKNMLIEPTPEELANFGEPDFTIYNAGACPADRTVKGVTSETVVAINFKAREQVILGTQYAGEMKKGVLTIMMYLMPKKGHLTMHASANEGKSGDVTVFFGLSGTGKTTLSADPARKLIGDDEHVWTDKGVFNIEGGCYAKAVGLSEATEPEIYHAIRFGAVAENCILDPKTKKINYNDISLTENTRVAYPLSFIPGAKLPAVGGHPKNIIFLTNDAFGVMPPVSLLTPGQAKFWFVTGYTAKVPGTEEGVREPSPTFSACFGGPFLVLHPTKYGEILAELMAKHNARCWLVNTGWSGGKFGQGKRMKLSITRRIIDAIHDGTLEKEKFQTVPGWGLRIPTKCAGVPDAVLNPIQSWSDKAEFVKTIDHVAALFRKNFDQYKAHASRDMLEAMPGPYAAAASKL